MQVCLRRAAVALTLGSASLAGVAAAQKAAHADSSASGCNPNSVPTQALAKATFSMQRAFQTFQNKGNATKDLKDAIRFLTTPAPKKEMGDSIARAYYLGQAYILMLQQPNVAPIGRRSTYGIATDTVLTVDLLAAADTQFTRVEKAWPACVGELAKWRQQKPWLDALNGAINALNGDPSKPDSAELLAKRALLIERTAPYAYSVLASVANSRKDYDTAVQMLQKVLELSGNDTTYANERLNAMYDMANVSTARAEAADAATRKARAQEAIAAWTAFMPVGTRDVQIANAEQSIVRLLTLTGDTSRLAEAYAPVLANPSKFGEQTLLNAGVIATRAKHPADAAKLFSAALEQNPNQRDAINNLAASYVGTGEYDKMFPLVDRLVSIDPNNAENWRLYAYAYSGKLKDLKDTKLTKAYTDSLVKYNEKAEHLATRVALTEFTHGQSSTTLGGTVENRAKTAKSYTLEIEFLDKTGAVVGTQTVNVGPVPPNETVPFTATIDKADAVAFRYKPLP